jgi:hypothetical protein
MVRSFSTTLYLLAQKLITLSRQEGIDEFTTSLAHLNAASLCHVNDVCYHLGDGSWKLYANLKYLRDNERGQSYFANKQKLGFCGQESFPSSHITHERAEVK